MNERERLSELILDSGELSNHCYAGFDAENLADYLLENGVVVLPCKVGDIVYYPCGAKVYEKKIVCYVNYGYTTAAFFNAELTESCEIQNFGKIVFLTKEEAEQALKGGNE